MGKKKKIETEQEALKYLANNRVKVDSKVIHLGEMTGVHTWGIVDLLTKNYGYRTEKK